MADLKLGNIKPVGADNVVVDGKYVKGGFVVVSSTTERDALKGSSGENIVNGSLCYCTGDSKFYQYNGTQWVEKTFGATSDATTTASGLMSAADKAKLDGIATEANKYVHPSTHAASMITGLATVATSGSYNDLTNKPTIPTDTNQKVKTGSVTFGANDTVEFVAGSNVAISGDATNKKITISSTDSYSHPTYDSKASGLYKITVDNGHVSATTAVTKADITSLGIPAQDTTYSNATTGKDGLMSKTDKANLDTIVTSFSSDDSNTTIDTVKEVLKAFENAPEGTNIANALAAKSNVGHNHEVTTAKAAPQAHTHNVTVSGTTGANNGTAVTAVTGVAADGTATVLTGVKASGTDTFIKTINGGEGTLTSNTTTDNGIKYVESVTHTGASLTGTKTFNTDAIKDVTLSASTTNTDGPAYIESVTHTAASLGGTKTFNTDAIKSVTLSASTTTSDGPKYVESISGSAPTLTGDTTFVKTQGTFNAGTTPVSSASFSGTKTNSLVTAATTKYLHLNAGTTPASGATPSHTSTNSGANSGSGVSAVNASYSAGVLTLSAVTAAPNSHTHTYDKTTSVSLTAGTAPSLTCNTTSTDGTAVITGVTKGDYTPVGSISLTRGTAPSLGAATTGTVGLDGGEYTATTKYMKAAGTAASTGTVTISGGSITPVTKYMKKTTTAASTGTVGISGGSTTTSTKYLHHSHTPASSATTGTAVTGVASDGTAKVLTGVKASSTASVAPSGHAHSYGNTTALTTGTNSGTAVDAVTELADATN